MAALAELESGERSFLLQKLAEQGCARVRDLELLSGLGAERIADHLAALAGQEKVIPLADQWTSAETARIWRQKLLEATDRFHGENSLLPGIPRATLKGSLPQALSQKGFDALLEGVLASKELVQTGDSLARPGFSAAPPPAMMREVERIEKAYREAGTQAKNKREMLERLGMNPEKSEPCFAYLIAQGRLMRLSDETLFDMETYRGALESLRSHFAKKETLTLAEFRDQIGSARKQVQALLEHFDGLKYTMRRGDERVAWKLPKG